jgi:hypothetical protein
MTILEECMYSVHLNEVVLTVEAEKRVKMCLCKDLFIHPPAPEKSNYLSNMGSGMSNRLMCGFLLVAGFAVHKQSGTEIYLNNKIKHLNEGAALYKKF